MSSKVQSHLHGGEVHIPLKIPSFGSLLLVVCILRKAYNTGLLLYF